MPPAGLEPAIPASERSQTHALHRVATGIDCDIHTKYINHWTNTARNCLMLNLGVHEVTGAWGGVVVKALRY